MSQGLIFLRKTQLWLPVVFAISVVPQLMGSYAFLREHGVEWYFAAVGAAGVEWGGAVFTIYNTLTQLAVPDVHTGYAAMLLLGVLSSILSLLWLVYIVTYLNRGLTPVMGRFHVSILLIAFLSLSLVITLAIDQYMLPGTATRVTGMTYFLEYPRTSLRPITFLVEEHVLSGGSTAVNGTGSLNGTALDGVPAEAFPAVG